ncbi:MAG: M50 family metallopeptidase [Patescibacteria group bacterium]|nr:M50 family metallopeptidase [Patescibacteria group bacterium]MDD5164586.1 M50 family metallopeptidase [Patescibacteria group bacterium]MDD5534341.1 M50 family metallopeptidase [Patescibacteria group bacterium]
MSILLTIIGLSIVIFFHEFGHFIFARIFGVRVEEFGFGYPPRMFGWIKTDKNKWNFKFFWNKNIPKEADKKTIYSVNWIPFGGFNKLKGEMGGQEKDDWGAQKWWKKVLIGAGGVCMNFILAIILFSFCFSAGIPQAVEQTTGGGKIKEIIGIQISMVSPNSSAEKAGIKIGDVVLSIDGQEIKTVEGLQNYIKPKVNQTVKIKIKRNLQIIEKEVNVLPASQNFQDIEESYGVIGVGLANIAIVSYPWYQSIYEGFKTTFLLIGQWCYSLYLIFKTLIIKHHMIGQFVGPVGLAAMGGEVARVGFIYLVQFLAIISVAIGVSQFIPIPGLDGSRILFAFIEGIRKKPIKQETENFILTIGFYLLLVLAVLLTYQDLAHLFSKFFK